MYHIDYKTDKPDIKFMKETLEKLMERGLRVDNCENILDNFKRIRDALKVKIQNEYGIENLNSAVQVSNFLRDKSNETVQGEVNDIINICYDNINNKFLTGADYLEKLADFGYEFAKDILEYRHYKKYCEVIESINKAVDENNLIHPKVELGKTNRINYKEPGIMTIPKDLLWHIIKPYKKDNTLYSIDIKNQEPNILINITGADDIKYALESEEGLYETLFKRCYRPSAKANVLIDTFNENRVYSISEIEKIGVISPAYYSPKKTEVKDVYYNNERVIAIETICLGSEKGLEPNLPEKVSVETENGNIYNLAVDWEYDKKKVNKSNDYECTGYFRDLEVRVGKAERNEFKTSWNALSYGASAFYIKENCRFIDGKKLYDFFKNISAFKNYTSIIDKMARDGDTVIRTLFGTKMDAGCTRDWKHLKRVLLDLPIQGTGADILSLLIKRFYSYIKEKSIENYMSLYYTRNDELIIEVEKQYLEDIGESDIKNILKDMLEHQINNWTPFKVEVKKVTIEEVL